MIGEHVNEDAGPVEVVVGIETDRGPWVQALVASGYLVYPINPLQVARFRETERSSGGKSDAADAHTLTDMVRLRRHTLRPMAGDSARAETVKGAPPGAPDADLGTHPAPAAAAADAARVLPRHAARVRRPGRP